MARRIRLKRGRVSRSTGESNELDEKATLEEVFLQMHVRKTKKQRVAVTKEGTEGQIDVQGGVTAPTFTNTRAQAVYDKVKELERDPANVDKPQELLWLMASGGPSHGRKFGL